MWIVVYLVKGIEAVIEIRNLLESHGILVMTKKKTDGDESQAFYDILVPQTEAGEAQELLIMIERD